MIKHLTFRAFPNTNHPFNIKAFQAQGTLSLNQPITIFVGDNGSGKSTLLKAIAYANHSINVSKHEINSPYYQDSIALANAMTLSHTTKTRSGFFFSGEDFITYINRLKEMKTELQKDLKEIEAEFKHKSDYVKGLALGPIRKELHSLETTYSGELNERSHGEGFLTFFKARMHQQGLYLLDEPETPLSAINQYQLMVLLTDLARSGSQIILATHSPILMALEDAVIYHFDESGIHEIQYDDIETVQFTKHFLLDPTNYTRRI
jgi:predicted ATPase